MTYLLRRKRLITALVRNIMARMPASIVGSAILLFTFSTVQAQQASPQPWSTVPPLSPRTVQPAQFQQPPGPGNSNMVYEEEVAKQTIQLEPPGPDRLFRLESEDALKERWRQELKSTRPGDRQIYPEEPILTRDIYYGRHWQPRVLTVEPNYLCYKRLLFEQKNFERYGWDLGPVSTALSPLLFFGDVIALPYNALKDPFRHCECNAGYCLPGDPVPLLIYPPELSASGALAETASVLALLAIFP